MACAHSELEIGFEVAVGLEKLSGGNPAVAAMAGAALRARGLAEPESESDPDALLGAVDDYRASPHRHELARTAEDAAAARAGRRSEARASAAEAFQLYSGMGLAGKRPWRRAQRGGGRGTACPGAPGGGPR